MLTPPTKGQIKYFGPYQPKSANARQSKTSFIGRLLLPFLSTIVLDRYILTASCTRYVSISKDRRLYNGLVMFASWLYGRLRPHRKLYIMTTNDISDVMNIYEGLEGFPKSLDITSVVRESKYHLSEQQENSIVFLIPFCRM